MQGLSRAVTIYFTGFAHKSPAGDTPARDFLPLGSAANPQRIVAGSGPRYHQGRFRIGVYMAVSILDDTSAMPDGVMPPCPRI
jgi:hypothetical protein